MITEKIFPYPFQSADFLLAGGISWDRFLEPIAVDLRRTVHRGITVTAISSVVNEQFETVYISLLLPGVDPGLTVAMEFLHVLHGPYTPIELRILLVDALKGLIVRLQMLQ